MDTGAEKWSPCNVTIKEWKQQEIQGSNYSQSGEGIETARGRGKVNTKANEIILTERKR